VSPIDLSAVLANWAPMSTQRKLPESRRVDMAAQISDSASARRALAKLWLAGAELASSA
jgi:hypothetical protein